MSIYNFVVKDHAGKDQSMEQYQGKVLLIVNTASKCGFTKQYEGLENLYKKYKDQGFEILAFPCNQFGSQEPGTNEEIKNFCTLTYDVTFPIMAKVDVNGEDELPLFNFLKNETKGVFGKDIKWNFTKFLIDRQGNVIRRYAPTKTPESIEKDLIKIF